MPDPSPPALRPVAELALGVARLGEGEVPVVPAPAALRPFLSFARLPPTAQALALRVVDEDEAFRQRVRDAACAEDVGEAGWLFLCRPEGWQDACAAVSGSSRGPGGGGGAGERDQRRSARRQAHADAARARLEERVARAEGELDRLRAEAGELRRAQRVSLAEVDKLSAELVSANEQRSQAVRQFKASEALVAERSVEARKLRQRVNDLEALLAGAAATSATGAAAVDAPAVAAAASGLTRAAAAAVEAATAADRLAVALSEAVAALGVEVGPSAGPSRAQEPLRPLRRTAARLPAGVVDDTEPAAEHLLRLPGAILLVDGYNVSKTGWPDLELGTQRLRLVNGLADLRARTGAQVEVVFDGVEQRQLAARGIPSTVRVRFSPAGVEADDLVLELVEDLPLSRPVIVVSTDKRVRDGARQRGASTLSSQTLLSVLR